MNKFFVLILFSILIFILNSCKDDETKSLETNSFRIEFGDSIKLYEDDISFYDSSTCILFLKNDLSVNVGVGSPPISCTKFAVFINNDTIYQGVIYPNTNFQSVPLTPIYISSKTYPAMSSKILPIMGLKSIINNNKLIEILKEKNLLLHGISCSIDSVCKTSQSDSVLNCTITYKNLDNISYYLPDPLKMGEVFASWGRFALFNKETTEVSYSTSTFWIESSWNWEMKHLSILPANGQVSYTFKATFQQNVDKGVYQCLFRLNNNDHFLPFPIPLIQGDARVWVGYVFANKELIIR